ncbi:MAG: leishmanolysin-related zinc metalloendopeptidase [Thermostichus sp. BF3_bins_97]
MHHLFLQGFPSHAWSRHLGILFCSTGKTFSLLLLLLSLGLASCGASGLGSPPPQTGSFSIQWRFLDPAPSSSQLAVFARAAQRWQSLIVLKLAPVALRLGPNHCLPGSPPLEQPVDDLLIDVQAIPIDGPGQVLGLASPCVLRQADQMPVYGFMQLDREDLQELEASGRLETVLLHEIAHVLGFGSLWQQRHLLAGFGSADPRYLGQRANEQFSRLGGIGLTPLENEGGNLSRDVHWRAADLEGELMTGSPGQSLSVLSLAALADLGYGVNWQGADPFELPQGSPSPAEARTTSSDYREWAYSGPFWWVDGQGSLTLQRTRRG